jgi:hypothetical protein
MQTDQDEAQVIDRRLREMALSAALNMFTAMAEANLFKAGAIGPDHVLGAAQVFYAFLKGEGK